MSKIPAFLFGVVVGGALIFSALKYHVVRADDGLHVVPKLSSQFSEVYVDIRPFTITDWNDHKSLAVALMQAKKGHLIKESATSGLMRSLDNVINTLHNHEG